MAMADLFPLLSLGYLRLKTVLQTQIGIRTLHFQGVDVVDTKVTETIDYKVEDSTDLESRSCTSNYCH